MKTPAEIIRREIVARGGVLPFVRFMELALYYPNPGYYEKTKNNVGRRGDFYTSVSVGELFGQLLAFQFAEWLEELSAENAELKIIEGGAHDGQLAKDILTWLQSNRPKFSKKVNYVIVEPSSRRQKWQRETLKIFSGGVHWLSGFPASTIQRFNGIIFSNELLDAFPVHRLGWDAKKKKWFEWGVAVVGEKFVWSSMPEPIHISSPRLHTTPELLEVLPHNYTIEISPAAENWWRCAAESLNYGKLLTADYGLTDDELFLPQRKNGTLRAYSRHRFAGDLLGDPGNQDLTAHVNFSGIQKTGDKAGLKTEFFSTQAKFLAQILKKTLKAGNFGEWTSARGRQFQTLTHPEHMGRAFRVLVQSR